MDWLGIPALLSEGLDRLAAFVEEDPMAPNQAPPAMPVSSEDIASPSNGRLNAAPAKVYAAWTDPEKIIRGSDVGCQAWLV